MPSGLRRYHHSGQSHFLTFSCYHREPCFQSVVAYDQFLPCLEDMRVKFGTFIYGYVVMPEHVHLLLSEPERKTLADAMQFLKLSFVKRLHSTAHGPQAMPDRFGRRADTTETFAMRKSSRSNSTTFTTTR